MLDLLRYRVLDVERVERRHVIDCRGRGSARHLGRAGRGFDRERVVLRQRGTGRKREGGGRAGEGRWRLRGEAASGGLVPAAVAREAPGGRVALWADETSGAHEASRGSVQGAVEGTK